MIEPETDEVRTEWEDFLKDEYDVNLKGNGFLANKDVLRAEGVDFKAISNKKMDFYTRIVEKDQKTQICVFGSFGYDIHLNPNTYPLEYMRMKDITKRFLKGYLPGYYSERISKAQEELKDLQEERNDMEEEMKKNKEEIESLTKRNKELDKSISENKSKIEDTSDLLQTKQQTFDRVNNTLKNFDKEQ